MTPTQDTVTTDIVERIKGYGATCRHFAGCNYDENNTLNVWAEGFEQAAAEIDRLREEVKDVHVLLSKVDQKAHLEIDAMRAELETARAALQRRSRGDVAD